MTGTRIARCAAVAIAVVQGGCGLAPRMDYKEGAVVAHSYDIDYQRLVSCVFDRFDTKGGVIKTDFPERKTARLHKDTGDSAIRYFHLDFASEGPGRTHVSSSIPVNHTRMHPDSLFPDVDACARRIS